MFVIIENGGDVSDRILAMAKPLTLFKLEHLS
jgi:hypothetical protein